jgi:diguanylate cyclase (GGDEF)-like protein
VPVDVRATPPGTSGAGKPATLSPSARTGPLGTALGATAGATGSQADAADPGAIAGALAPATAAIGARGASGAEGSGRTSVGPAHRARSRTSGALANDPAATVIERFINVIPAGVWIALAVSLALAAVAGAAALRSNRRFRRQAGEVAAVTAAALTDPLTGVLNRRGFIEAAERELLRARRYGRPLALAFVDIRGLKAVNDTEGHLAGDRLLRRVTLLLRESARTHDVVGRIGGDELAVLLAEQSVDGAAAMTQRVRAQVPAHRASLQLTTPWDVTIGTATFPEDGDNFEELLEAADRRLYEQRGIRLT